MRAIRGGILTLGMLAVAAVPAQAQVAPVDGGTNVGGSVDSSIELILTQPAGLSKFTKAGTYTTSFTVMATTTENAVQLSLADGEATSGSKLGHMASGSKRLKDALEARAGSAAFQPLDDSVDPLLQRWAGPVTRKEAKVTLRQKVSGKPSSGAYRKVLWATLSSETP
jgi:hypothetical protein